MIRKVKPGRKWDNNRDSILQLSGTRPSLRFGRRALVNRAAGGVSALSGFDPWREWSQRCCLPRSTDCGRDGSAEGGVLVRGAARKRGGLRRRERSG